MFAHARSNAPCVLFFDDFDALGCNRGAPQLAGSAGGESEDGASHDLGARVLSTFLNELDGVSSGASSSY